MRHAEGVPEDNVGVFDAFVAVRGDPGGQALRGLTGGLWDVAARGVDLVVVVYVVLESGKERNAIKYRKERLEWNRRKKVPLGSFS